MRSAKKRTTEVDSPMGCLLLLDQSLAREIELAEAQAAVACVEKLKGLKPEASSTVEPSRAAMQFTGGRIHPQRSRWDSDLTGLSAPKSLTASRDFTSAAKSLCALKPAHWRTPACSNNIASAAIA